jgi:hypothetical protein
MGRPNSPPPGLLKGEDTSRAQKCKSHVRANPLAPKCYMLLTSQKRNKGNAEIHFNGWFSHPFNH